MFVIHGSGGPVVLEASWEALRGLYPELEGERPGSPALLLTASAARELKDRVGWGRRTRENALEQGGLLVGRPFLTDGVVLSVAEGLVPAVPRRASPVSLELDAGAWGRMLEQFDGEDRGRQVVGWYHTHPRELGTSLSGVDLGTQRRFFTEEWHFALVLNPHRELAACFHGGGGEGGSLLPRSFAAGQGTEETETDNERAFQDRPPDR